MEENHSPKPDLSIFRKAMNMRELGGYRARDGRTVKHGIFFRCAAPGDMTPEELGELSKLNLRYVLDLRSKEEAEKVPEPVIPGAFQERISGAYDANDNEIDMEPKSIYRMLFNPRRKDPDPEENIISAIAEIYTSLAFDSHAYRRLMTQLEDDQVPVLFHCTAGKDRTGIAAMIILMALGVPEETIVADFALTNEYRQGVIDAKLAKHPLARRFKIVRFAVHAVEGVHESFGARVIDEICQEYGTIDVYLEKEFGLAGERLAAFRDKYLE